MATPRDNPSDLSGRQSAELIRDLLDTKHSQSYMLFSLDNGVRLTYRKEIFHNRVRWRSSQRLNRTFVFEGDRSAVVRRETSAPIDRSVVFVSEDQFVSSRIVDTRRRSPLFGWKKSSGLWHVCIHRLSRHLSSSGSHRSILRISTLCPSSLDHVTEKVRWKADLQSREDRVI